MAIVSAHQTDVGLNKGRPYNEDYVWVDEQAGLYIVADGMGGQEAGDVASRLTATTVGDLISEQLKQATLPLSTAQAKEVIINAVEAANEIVYQEARSAGQKRTMGSTIVLALIQTSTAFISHAGDSRVYLARDDSFTQLTEDNSWEAEFGGLKGMTQLRQDHLNHFLTKSVGQGSNVEPSFLEIKLHPGDCLLLCSDGFWRMVNPTIIQSELQKITADPTTAVQALVAAAHAAGGEDNLSLIVIKKA